MRRSRVIGALAALLLAGSFLVSVPASAGTGLVYQTVDSDSDPYGGIYLRGGTSMDNVDRVYARYMVYGDSVELLCGTDGEPVGPRSNRRWHQVRVLSGPATSQLGWIADRYLNTPNAANQKTPGEPDCEGPTAPPQPQVLPDGGGIYFQPRWTAGDPYPSEGVLTISRDKWSYGATVAKSKADCQTDKVDDHIPSTLHGRRVTTMGAWSSARMAPIYLIEQNFELARQFNFIVLYDPGSHANFFDPEGCDQFYDSSGLLARWLAASPGNVLMILAGHDTHDPNWRGHGTHEGIQQKLFPQIRGDQQLASQVYVCNYSSMPHKDVLGNFRGVMVSGRTTTCPQGIAAWHP